MKPLADLFPELHIPRKVGITMHQKPDADAMGSAMALSAFLQLLGHQVKVISPTNWAGWLNWMPGCKDVIDFDRHRAAAEEALKEIDWLFCLDFNHLDRTKNLAPVLAALDCTRILIDHHREPDEATFQYGLSDTSKSSTCEMIYDLIVSSGNADRINSSIADCIYAGVIADTGSFRFSSTHAGVHRLVADLKDRGLEHMHVHDQLFDNYLENRLRFIGHVLLHRMEVMYEYNTVLLTVPKSDLLRYHIKTGDTEGLVNFPQTIQGIKMVAIVIDRDEERKWSFRSKGEFDCNSFARKYFEGGGHFNASGGRSGKTIEQTVADFKLALKENKHLLE